MRLFCPQTIGFFFIVPLLLIVIAGFNLPLLTILGQSVIEDSTWTLAHFYDFAQAGVYLKVLGNTFRIAIITVVFCVLLGYPLAYWLKGLPARWQILGVAAVVIPFWISMLVRTYAWIVMLGNVGLVNRGLLWIGWIDTPIPFLYNEPGVIIGTVNVLLPFLVLPLLAAMRKIDDRLIRAAETLGASPWTAFWRVFLPLSLPALGAGVVLVFILTLGFYITPAILGGGRVPMIANMLDILINQTPNWGLAAAISVVLLAATLFLFAVYQRFNQTEQPT